MRRTLSSIVRSSRVLLLGSTLIATAGFAQQTTPGTAAPPSPAMSTIVGFVFDSTTKRPLADATVQMVTKDDITNGRSFSVVSDSSGYFLITDVPFGSYVITFFHQRLEDLAVSAPLRAVEARTGRTNIELGIPSVRRLIALHCGAQQASDSSGLLVGTVIKADRPEPVARAIVTAQWFELSFGATGMVRSTPRVEAIADDNGRFRMCGLPDDAAVSVWAASGRASTGAVSVDVKPSVVTTLELALDVADTVEATAASGPVRRGSAQVSGSILSPTGAPMPGARVALRGSDNETIADASGAFTLTELPSGTQSLEARAIGFVPVARTVTLSATRPLHYDIRFDSAARILETVEVHGKVLYDRSAEEFAKLKKRGFGYFIDRDMIDRRQPFNTTDLLRTAPGVSVYSGRGPGSGTNIQIRGSGNFQGTCQPGLVLDGMPLGNESTRDLDFLARPEDVAAIAVYRGPSEVPAEYQSSASCGLIQIWTRRGGTPRKAKK
jgi:hypothetical protein